MGYIQSIELRIKKCGQELISHAIQKRMFLKFFHWIINQHGKEIYEIMIF